MTMSNITLITLLSYDFMILKLQLVILIHLHLHLHLQGNGYKEAYACENPYLILHQYLSRFDLKAFTDFDDIINNPVAEEIHSAL